LLDFLLRGILLRLSVFARLQGLFQAALSGSRGSVAGSNPASSGSVEPNEATLAGLEHGPVQSCPRHVELADRVAVELHSALRYQPARLARGEPECVGEERRKMDGIACRQWHSLQSLHPRR